MAKKIQLTIPKPCHEDWDAMTPVQQGKFCGSCRKQVVDFSEMSDRQVAEFFKKPSTGSVCGRFMTDQLDRDIEIPKKRIPWLKYFFTIALPAFFVSIKVSASRTQGKIKVTTAPADTTRKNIYDDVKMMGMVTRPQSIRPFTKEPVEKPIAKDTTPVCSKVLTDKSEVLALPGEVVVVAGGISVKRDNENIIRGIVVDDAGNSVPFASVETVDKKITIADEDGYFELGSKPKSKTQKLVVTAAGFFKKEYFVGESLTADKKQLVCLTSNGILPEVVLNSGYVVGKLVRTQTKSPVASIMGGVMNSVKVSTINKNESEVFVPNNIIKLFPNPIPSGTALTIEWKQADEGYYSLQLVNQSGQLMHQKEIWIDAEARLLNINLPVVAAGSYLFVLANKRTGKKLTERVVVQ